MTTSSSRARSFAFVVFFAAVCGFAAAGDRCDIRYANGLDAEIVDIRVKFSTSDGEPRYHGSRVNLPAGEESRIGVQGATLPEVIIFDCVDRSLVFDDLSGVSPTNDIHFKVVHEGGIPRLRLMDAEGEAEGSERVYLTIVNRSNAVDKDDVVKANDFDSLETLIRKQIEDARDEMGELTRFDLDAGPIWNQENALERCPDVAREWSAENDREARWTGGWRTTVPGKMSVCECIAGTADIGETVTLEDAGWGNRAYFPVFWKDWRGVGAVSEDDSEDDGVIVRMRFSLPGGGAPAMLNELFEDLRVDGFRPLLFSLKTAAMDEEGDFDVRENEIDFRQSTDDKWDAHERIVEALEEAYATSALSGEVMWVDEQAFEKAKSGEEVAEFRGVLCSFGRETLDAVFFPDAGRFMELGTER